jgi:hypothetical protein
LGSWKLERDALGAGIRTPRLSARALRGWLPALTATAAATAAATSAATTATATTAAAAAVSAATTAAATATAAAAVSAAATTTAATTTTPVLGLFHGDLATLHVTAVELFNGLACLLLVRHLNEAEPARTPGLTIGDDLGVGDGAQTRKQLAQVELGDAVRQVANVESRSHFFLAASMTDGAAVSEPSNIFRSPKDVPATIAGGDDEDGDEGVSRKISTALARRCKFFSCFTDAADSFPAHKTGGI